MLSLNHTQEPVEQQNPQLDEDGWPINRFKPLYFNNPRLPDRFNPALPIGYIYGEPVYYRPKWANYIPTAIIGNTDEGMPIKYHNDYTVNYVDRVPQVFDQLATIPMPEAPGEVEVDSTYKAGTDVDTQYNMAPKPVQPIVIDGKVPFADAVSKLMSPGTLNNLDKLPVGDEGVAEGEWYINDDPEIERLMDLNEAINSGKMAPLSELKTEYIDHNDDPDIDQMRKDVQKAYEETEKIIAENPSILQETPSTNGVPQPRFQPVYQCGYVMTPQQMNSYYQGTGYQQQQPVNGYYQNTGYQTMAPREDYYNPYPQYSGGNMVPLQQQQPYGPFWYLNQPPQQNYGYGYNNGYMPLRSYQEQNVYQQNYIELQKLKYKICCSVTGTEYSEEVAEMLFNPYYEQQNQQKDPVQLERDRIWEDTKRIVRYANDPNNVYYSQEQLEGMFMQEQMRNYHEALDSHNLCEFLEEDLPRLNREIWISKYIDKNASRNLSKTYNSQAYNQLLMSHATSNPYIMKIIKEGHYDNITEEMGVIELLKNKGSPGKGLDGLPAFMHSPEIEKHRKMFTESILEQFREKTRRQMAANQAKEQERIRKSQAMPELNGMILQDDEAEAHIEAQIMSNGQLNE